MPLSDNTNGAVDDSILAERWAAYLKLKCCNKHGACINFELSYNSNGCQEAPGMDHIEIFYSNNAAFVAWNRGRCSGRHTLYASGCNSGGQDHVSGTPGTQSFTYTVGCYF